MHGSNVEDGTQAGRLIKYSRLGIADSVRSGKDQWTAMHYKAAIGFVQNSTTCITAVGQQETSPILYVDGWSVTIEISFTLNGKDYSLKGEMPSRERKTSYPLCSPSAIAGQNMGFE